MPLAARERNLWKTPNLSVDEMTTSLQEPGAPEEDDPGPTELVSRKLLEWFWSRSSAFQNATLFLLASWLLGGFYGSVEWYFVRLELQQLKGQFWTLEKHLARASDSIDQLDKEKVEIERRAERADVAHRTCEDERNALERTRSVELIRAYTESCDGKLDLLRATAERIDCVRGSWDYVEHRCRETISSNCMNAWLGVTRIQVLPEIPSDDPR